MLSAATAGPMPLSVRLLGAFEVSVGDRLIPDAAWRTQKARGLFKILCLAPAHRLHREQVLDLLWSTLEPRAAANNFRTTLHDARRALGSSAPVAGGAPPLRLTGDSLSLEQDDGLWIDVDAFETAAAEAKRARTPAAFRSAINLYRGDLLPEDRYEDWAASRRDSLRESFVSLLVGLAGMYERLQKPEAIDLLQRVVGLEPTHEQAHADLMRLYALTGQRRQALRQFERLRKALRDELDVEPEARSEQLYAAILAGQFADGAQQSAGPISPPASAPENNLPISLTSFVGRQHEIGRLREALVETRLLTVVGPGGSGKTRLALEVARDVIDAYPDGVWFVELAALTDGSHVPQTVASLLGVPEQLDRSPVDLLTEALRSREVLVVLDNCEHLIDDCSRLATALLGACNQLTILATSREAVGVSGELAWRIPLLAVPDPGSLPTVEHAGRSDAVRLFVERARFLRPDFELTDANVGAIAKICHRVEGLPLAIELAAARVAALAIEDLADRLENTLQILTGGSRTGTSRHRTLRATLQWSYDLLTEAEQRVFERLAVFAGGWTLEAAEAVAAGDAVDEGAVLDLLARLVDKSLVLTQPVPGAELRYQLLEPVKQYGRERLDARGDAEAAHLRHARHFAAVAERGTAGLRSADQATWLARLEREHDNLRAALQWAFDRDVELAVGLASVMWRFWYIHGHLGEGHDWLQRALSSSGSFPPLVRAKVLTAAGSLAWARGELDDAERLGRESLPLVRQTDDAKCLRDTLGLLGTSLLNKGEFAAARQYHEENLALARAAGDAWGISLSLSNLAEVAYAQGDHDAAARHWEECLAIDRSLNDARGVATVTHNLAEVMRARGDLAGARDRFAESLTLFRPLGFLYGVASVLANLAEVAMELGDDHEAQRLLDDALAAAKELAHPALAATAIEFTGKLAARRGEADRAARLFGAADALRESARAPRSVIEQAKLAPWYSAAQDDISEPLIRAWAEGRVLTVEDALAEAFAVVGTGAEPGASAVPTAVAPAALTGREREIVVLLADGLTNRQIAVALGMARPTAEKHVGNILRKLALPSRREVRAWAIEHGVVAEHGPTHR